MVSLNNHSLFYVWKWMFFIIFFSNVHFLSHFPLCTGYFYRKILKNTEYQIMTSIKNLIEFYQKISWRFIISISLKTTLSPTNNRTFYKNRKSHLHMIRKRRKFIVLLAFYTAFLFLILLLFPHHQDLFPLLMCYEGLPIHLFFLQKE